MNESNKITKARYFLEKIGMPNRQQANICCLSLLALAGITRKMSWTAATNNWIRIHDIIAFAKKYYGITYAENSRETFRKQAMHHFRNAALIEDNGEATNSPNYCYRLTNEALSTVQTLGEKKREKAIEYFLEHHRQLKDIYASKRKLKLIPVKINNRDYTLSKGKHNELQKAIVEQFAPRFAPGSSCLYVGDTTNKDLVKDVEALRNLGFGITLHDKMPDVVFYRKDKNWVYFVEAVTSVGPMDPKRILEISKMTENVTAGKIFVTAFLDFKSYRRYSDQLAWETEVWIADKPDHMIHLNGNKFLGPR